MLNDSPIPCVNPPTLCGFDPNADTWIRFDLMDNLPVVGANIISLRLAKRNQYLSKELPVRLVDVELEVCYDFPMATGAAQPGWFPRTP